MSALFLWEQSPQTPPPDPKPPVVEASKPSSSGGDVLPVQPTQPVPVPVVLPVLPILPPGANPSAPTPPAPAQPDRTAHNVLSCLPEIELKLVTQYSGKEFPVTEPEIPIVDFSTYQALGKGSLVAVVTSSCVPEKEDQRAKVRWYKEQERAEQRQCYERAGPTTCWVEYDVPHVANSSNTKVPFDNSVKPGIYRATVTLPLRPAKEKIVKIVP